MVESNQKPADQAAVRSSRIKFLMVVALFVLPVGAAMFLHFTGWRPGSTINHGALVQPARPAPALAFSSSGKNSSDTKIFDQKWNLVVVVQGNCNEVCLKNLYAIKQIHIGQGKHQHRVRRIFIHNGEVNELQRIVAKYPQMTVVRANTEEFTRLVKWFTVDAGVKNLNGSRVYMVDPLGNYMMYYAPGFEPKGMRKDLARLLRVSRIG